MDRINTATRALNLFGAGKHGFKDGNLSAGIAATDLVAEWFNGVQEELLAVIEAAGLVPSAANRGQLLEALQIAHGGKPGDLVYTLGTTAPAGTIKANGANNLSRTAYARLFAAIGTSYGAGDGVTTFGVPDLRGEFVRGWDDGRGVDVGRLLGSWQASMLGSHVHNGTTSSSGAHTHGVPDADQNAGYGGNFDSGGITSVSRYVTTTEAGSHTHGFTTDATGGAETRPRNVAVLICIKY